MRQYYFNKETIAKQVDKKNDEMVIFHDVNFNKKCVALISTGLQKAYTINKMKSTLFNQYSAQQSI